MEIKGSNYHVRYDADENAVAFTGVLELASHAAYAPILHLLEQILAQRHDGFAIDVRELTYLDKQGIDVLTQVAIKARAHAGEITVRGSRRFPWQTAALPELTNINANVRVVFAS